jgi:hypothetical protein
MSAGWRHMSTGWRNMKGSRKQTLALRAFLVAMAVASGALFYAKAASAAPYELKSVSTQLSSAQAGEHADFTTAFELASEGGTPNGLTRDIIVAAPPGQIGNPQAFPRCPLGELLKGVEGSKCPQGAQVGISEVTLAGKINATLKTPVFNMPSPGGETVARFGLFAGPYPVLLNLRVNPIDYSLEAALEGAPSAAFLLGAKTTLWGVPAAESHDALRLTPKEGFFQELPAGGRPSDQPEVPFLSNPTDCTMKRELTVTALSYGEPQNPSTLSAPYPQISGCGKLDFQPSFTATPTNPEAAAPTGLDTTVVVPQDETPGGLATSTLKGAVVSLPQGMSVNPAAGDGLEACSEAQVGYGTTNPSNCPDASKLGSVEIDAPALESTLHGAVYQRTPEPGRLFGFWLVTDELGVHLKLPAEIQANPLTGQLTTVFNGIPSLGGNPQFPFEELRLHVFGGPRAPLATPPTCGTYYSHYEFTPWSGKPAVINDAPMQITTGCNKGGFAPTLQAGTLDPTAAHYSAFAMTLTRQDGEANPQSLSVHLPQGLLAKLAGVALCPEAGAGAGDCPAASQVGRLAAAAGFGGAPLWIPQADKAPTAIYLAGPYKGAPYSIIARVPAQAGPFDLGVVVTRAAIAVDPEAATATVTTDPLPQILEGVPIAYRAVHADIDRPEFTLNPTDCQRKEISATVTATNGAVASPSVPFRAMGCRDLSYSPHLKLSLKGPTRRSGHPAVKAVLTQPPGQANTASASVILPASEFIDQDHINNPCTRVQFREEACPPLSILGHVKATTPLLDTPLEGPVYFRSNGGERELPDVVADLRGAIHVTLVGFVDAVHKKGSETSRIRTRFMNVPDAPVTRFEMALFGGTKRGLLENSRNLCLTNRRAKLSFTAQNGLVQSSEPRIATSCKKK